MKAGLFNEGQLFINNELLSINKLDWNEHPTFSGVFMKHLITGNNTEHKYSCHLVKIEPNSEIGAHIHERKTEIHEILEGNGKCEIGEKTIKYAEGDISVIPSDIEHRVKAGNEGLTIFAKFFPALL